MKGMSAKYHIHMSEFGFYFQSVMAMIIRVVPIIGIAIFFAALAAIILAMGGSKKYSVVYVIIASVIALGVALVLAGGAIVGYMVATLGTGVQILHWIDEIVQYSYQYPLYPWEEAECARCHEYILSSIQTLTYDGVRNGAYGILCSVTAFFSLFWIGAPYKKN